MVNTPEDIKYAGLAIDWFQEKGYDFSEELNALFINKCIECNQPNIAVTRFLYRKGRIGSWSTPSSIYRLLNSLQTHQDHQSIVQLLHILAPKGVHFDIRSFEILFQTCLQMNSKESYDEVTKKAKVLLSADDYEALVKKYPSPIGENGGDAVSATS